MTAIEDDYDTIPSHFFATDDLRLHYKIVGSGKHPILFTAGTLGLYFLIYVPFNCFPQALWTIFDAS